MTQKTQEAIKFAQHWLGLAGKHGDPNAPTTVCIVDLAKAVVELNTELTAQKNRADELQKTVLDRLEDIDHYEYLLDKANAELAALKEKCRWRKQSEEPAPNDDTLIICLLKKGGRCSWQAVIQARFIKQFEEPENNIFFWRPLDLPGEDAK